MTEPQGPQPPRLPKSAAEPLPSGTEQIIELSTIAGGLAHEIRNSLSTFRMNLQLLEEDWQTIAPPGSDDQVEAAEITRRSRVRIGSLLKESRRLESILEDFLQFVNKRELKTVPCDLNELVGDLADFYRPQTEAHDVTMTIKPAAKPLVCEIDVNLMKQAILNLMINAQQSMVEGGQLTIHVGTESDKTARIDVMDTGHGIAPERAKHIFEAYYSTKKGGTGLGLATARQVIRGHGGRIHFQSEPPHGSCFTVLLPLKNISNS
ncbi:MAG: ATP-binding protein [Phycisphaerales bacterium]|nr:ATP-binding protein [Phycisphaerales bacterium]